ncbi:MAG: hypothetical protein GY746_00290 [Gammaproteobacteria bacterium]|nr:hypothetical protein [Gammaproteobacteria bacterium]
MSDLSPYAIKRAKLERQIADEIAESINSIFNNINYFGNEKLVVKAINDSIERQHRTLQQDFWRAMFQVIEQYGQSEYFDGRNEQAVQACKNIAEHHKVFGVALPRI